MIEHEASVTRSCEWWPSLGAGRGGSRLWCGRGLPWPARRQVGRRSVLRAADRAG